MSFKFTQLFLKMAEIVVGVGVYEDTKNKDKVFSLLKSLKEHENIFLVV